MWRRGGVRGDGPGNGPPDLPRDERLTPRRPAAATVVVTVLSRCASMVATVAAAIATRPHSQPIAPKLHASPCLQSLRPPTDAHSAADVHVCSSMLVTRLCQRPRPARETIRVMRAADAKENCMQRFSPPSLDHHVDVDQHCTRQREHGCAAVVAMAKRHEATRSQGDEPGKRESASASRCSERTATERGARKEPTRPPSVAWTARAL